MFKKKAKPAAPDAEVESAAAEGGEGTAPVKKKLSKKMMIIAAAGALVVLGGGGAAAFMLLGGGGGGGAEEPEVAEATPTDPDAEPFGQVSNGPSGTTYYTLPTMATNMNTPGGGQQSMSLKVTLELADPAAVERLEPNAPRLRDILLTFMRELRPEDLEGSQGTYQLRQEIQRRVNLVIAPAQVRSVLIQEMLIQ